MKYKIRFLIVRIVNRIFKVLHKTHYYTTKHGVKVFNRETGGPGAKTEAGEPFECSAKELFLGVDGLRDADTSAGLCIADSPHYDLIACSEKKDFKDCVYIKKEREGSLDGRDTVYYDDAFHLNSYEKAKKSISGQYAPVRVYTIRGVRYIADGKHRAALLAYKDLPIRCVAIRLSPATVVYMRELYKKMRRRSGRYGKNIELIKNIFEEYEEKLP